MKLNWLTTTAATAAYILSWAPVASAQTNAGAGTAPAAATESDAGEIVVTAQKREQRLSDVGLTITAQTGEQLKTAGVSEVTQLAKVVPGFTVGTSFEGYPVFSMRGVNFNAPQISAAPAVSTYIDEAILAYPPMTQGLLLDVERVEVLKGPQGTLFGQNATGGSINIIAAKPTRTFQAGMNGEVDQYGQVKVGGFISGPLSETLRARLAAETTQFGGWQRGYFIGRAKNGDQNKAAGRLLLDWTPTDRLKVAVNINGNYDHGEAIQSQLARVVPVIPANAMPGLIGYPLPRNARDTDIDPGFDTHAHDSLFQSVLRVDYDLNDSATLTSLTNYVDFKSRSRRNLDGVALFNGPDTDLIGNIKTFSQEVRVSGSFADGKVHYILGGNYEKDKIQDNLGLIFGGYSSIGPGTRFDSNFKVSTESKGLFGNVDFEVLPKLTLTGGLRYTWLRETQVGCSNSTTPQAAGLFNFISDLVRAASGLPPTTGFFTAGGCATINDDFPNVQNPNGPGLIPDGLPIGVNGVQKEHNLSWRAGVNYKFMNDSLLYGIISRGFKAGVFPVQTNIVSDTAAPVKQEELTSYEVGAKLSAMNGDLRVNVSAFYYDYRNKQFFTYELAPVVGSASALRNVPKSSVKGFDVDFVARPVQGLTLRGAVTYIKTRVGPYITQDFQGNLFDVTGSEFNFAPPWSGTFDAEYRFPVGNDLHGLVGIGGLFNSRTYSNLGELAPSLIPSYVVFDARVGLEGRKWHAGLFVRNFTNKYYITSLIPSGDTDTKYAGLPRTFGAQFGFTF